MAALDPFDTTMIEDLNRELKRCKPLTLYYKYKDGSREIGLTYAGESVSYILLRKEEDKMIITISRTLIGKGVKFKQRHLNTCLRYLAAMIASREGVPLVSEATSPISLFTMLKLFDCKILTPEGLVPQGKLSMPQCSRMITEKSFVEVYADTRDYEALVDAAFEAITTIQCTGLGGKYTRKVWKR
jgi:hypothetical protein